jgi:hypothetical protein
MMLIFMSKIIDDCLINLVPHGTGSIYTISRLRTHMRTHDACPKIIIEAMIKMTKKQKTLSTITTMGPLASTISTITISTIPFTTITTRMI